MRYQAGVAHVDRGRVVRQSGDLEGALTQFKRALEIDPGNQTAQQEIDQIQLQLSAQPPGGPPPPSSRCRGRTRFSATSEPSPARSSSSPSQPIPSPCTWSKTSRTSTGHRQSHRTQRSLRSRLHLQAHSRRPPQRQFGDAFRIVGTLSATFYKPVTPNTIFVAANTRRNVTELEEQAVQTFYLTNAAQQNDANELVIAIRNLLDPSVKIYLVPSQNAIVMRATPDQLLLAQKLLNDLDRARPEVVVDVAILEVNRSVERNLGITLPTSISLTPQANPNTTTGSGSTPTTGGTSTTPSNFTLNSLAHLNANNFSVGLGGGTVNALLSDTDTRILQNPSMRATDGQRAQLKIGQRIPIATGSYNAGVSTGVASIGVQTQFQYVDVGVNIDITPTVHYDHQVTLKMHIEVTAHQGDQTISGVTEPIIAQNITDQVIQLKDGEPSLLAGLITRQDSLNINGTPGVGELPLLKYLFTSRDKTVAKDEIVFLLVPHIVRESVLSLANTRAIDTGIGTSIELRRDPSLAKAALDPANPVRPRPAGPTTSAANAASAIARQLGQQAEPAAPPASGQSPAAQPQGQPAGAPISFSVVPANPSQTVGSTFQVAVMLNNAHDVFSVPLQIQFNPAVLQLVNVDSGDFLSRDGQLVSIVHRDDGNGLVTISTSRPPNVAGVSGQGSVCTLTFKAIAAGDSNLALVKVGAHNSAQANLPAVGSQAVVHVK